MRWFKRKNNVIELSDWIGKRCNAEFNLPYKEWPTEGYPANIIIKAVEMPLIMIKSWYGGKSMWINADIIKTISLFEE